MLQQRRRLALLICHVPTMMLLTLLRGPSAGGVKGKQGKVEARLSVSPSMDHLNLSRAQSAGDFLTGAAVRDGRAAYSSVRSPPVLPK